MRLATLNLLFALFWLVVAVPSLIGAYLYPNQPLLRLGGDGMPIGWLALGFVAYNLVRWYALRSAEERRHRPNEPPPWRRHQRERAPRSEGPPDPTFDFTDKPPPPSSPTDESIRPK